MLHHQATVDYKLKRNGRSHSFLYRCCRGMKAKPADCAKHVKRTTSQCVRKGCCVVNRRRRRSIRSSVIHARSGECVIRIHRHRNIDAVRATLDDDDDDDSDGEVAVCRMSFSVWMMTTKRQRQRQSAC